MTELMTGFELLAGRGLTDDLLARSIAGFFIKLYAERSCNLAVSHLQLLLTLTGEIDLTILLNSHCLFTMQVLCC